MAGAGSRLNGARGDLPKPLVPVGGRPLISYAIDAFAEAGVQRLHVVVGANGDSLGKELRSLVEPRMTLHAISNPDWQKQNGISVLCAEGVVQAPFYLAMADHLFDASILQQLRARADLQKLNLAIDRKIKSIFDLDDAMKVQTSGDRVVAISKTLAKYDAIDTGLFLCSNAIFHYLYRAKHDGDCSLADGVRLMAAEDQVQAIDIGDAWWQDVDTPEMLARAELESARFFRENHRRGTQENIPGQR